MDFENISVGTDIEEIARFSNKTRDNDSHFLNRIFTEKELTYCFKDKQSAQHLCARFCAKEAVVKALTALGTEDVFYADIEILNHSNGSPYVVINKYPKIKVRISLSHSHTYATATAICFKE